MNCGDSVETPGLAFRFDGAGPCAADPLCRAAQGAGREVVNVEQERDRDPREGLSSEQLSILRQIARGASRAEAAAAHRVSEERLKGWERASWFRQALAKEKESPWTNGKLVAAGLRRHTGEQLAQVPRSTAARRTMAIDLLSVGVSVTEAAPLVGYTRQHLSTLSNNDPNFQAEFERRKVEDQQRRSSGLWHVWEEALLVVKRALEEGDTRIAMEVVKLGARGVTDVRVITEDSQDSHSEPVPSEADGSGAVTAVDGATPSGAMCRDCGLVARSERGLKQHRRAKHVS